MSNFDLEINNYDINDMKKFISLKDNYNTFELHKCVEDKIYQIGKSKMDVNLKKELYKFIKQIQFKLKDNLNYFHKKEEDKFENSYKIDHINAQISDLKKDLLKRSETEKETVYISPVNQGLVNPLKKHTLTSQLSIDTKFRKNYFNTKSTDFTINLSTPLKNVVSMKLSSLEIANVQHSISHNNGTNTFYIKKIDSNNDVFENTVSIPSGNYNSDDIVTEINKLLSTLNCSVEINRITMRTTILGNDTSDELLLDFSNKLITSAPPMKSLGWLLGYRNRKYEGHHSYTSEATADLGGIKYFFLCVNDFKNTRQEVCTILYENSFLRKNILARIPMREGKGIVLFDDASDKITKKRHYLGPVNIDKLHITLIDEYGSIIDLNENDYSFALEFDILYEK